MFFLFLSARACKPNKTNPIPLESKCRGDLDLLPNMRSVEVLVSDVGSCSMFQTLPTISFEPE